MKIVIFAGGVGTRLWPLSRKNTPKQFEKIFEDKSTLQATIDRLRPEFQPEDIFVATGKRYEKIVFAQLPDFPKDNFIFEPEMRDVGPAIGLTAMILKKRFENEPIAILWSDHLVKNIEAFKKGLKMSEQMIVKNNANFVYIAQKPRFANQNMGWIELGDEVKQENNIGIYEFKKLRYRPSIDEANKFFNNKNYVWNLGYFVSTPTFLVSLFKEHAPSMFDNLTKIEKDIGSVNFESTLSKIYPSLEKISFDDAILVKMEKDRVFVISSDLGWSDIGAWESLKEALSEKEDENVVKGKVLLEDSSDTLAFSYTDQLTVGIDLKDMLVITTPDVILVCPKSSVPKIKKLVEKLAGTEHESLT